MSTEEIDTPKQAIQNYNCTFVHPFFQNESIIFLYSAEISPKAAIIILNRIVRTTLYFADNFGFNIL
jgi:hypothetical protein